MSNRVGRGKAPKLNNMSTQEVFVQQFTKLFQHYSSALSSTEQEAAPEPSNSELADESNRLVAAARLAILELETNASLRRKRQALFRQAWRGGVGMLNQLILTARLWMGQSPSMLVKAWVRPAKLLLGRLKSILGRDIMGRSSRTVLKTSVANSRLRSLEWS